MVCRSYQIGRNANFRLFSYANATKPCSSVRPHASPKCPAAPSSGPEQVRGVATQHLSASLLKGKVLVGSCYSFRSMSSVKDSSQLKQAKSLSAIESPREETEQTGRRPPSGSLFTRQGLLRCRDYGRARTHTHSFFSPSDPRRQTTFTVIYTIITQDCTEPAYE